MTPKIVYLVTEDWFFCSHFLPMARAARKIGLDVVVATRCQDHVDAIEREGIRIIPLPWRRSEEGPAGLIRDFLGLLALLRRERPDILHCVALKPVILGGLAARFWPRLNVVCAVTGLGRTSVDEGVVASARRVMIHRMLRLVAGNSRSRLLVENRNHERAFAQAGLAPPGRIVRVPGAGVDLDRFRPGPARPSGPHVTAALVARMIPIKGVEIAVEAVEMLSRRGVQLRLILAGEPDPGHQGAISERTLRVWSENLSICWVGRREEINALWAQTDIAVLPSLGGDGLPKSLLEAAACGKPIVTTDTDGCREVVANGRNGFLVPPGDAKALAEALEKLVADPSLRMEMGRASRRMAEELFAESIVSGIVSDLYRTLLQQLPRSGEGASPASMP